MPEMIGPGDEQGPEECADVDAVLDFAAWEAGLLSADDAHRLARHIHGCTSCQFLLVVLVASLPPVAPETLEGMSPLLRAAYGGTRC